MLEPVHHHPLKFGPTVQQPFDRSQVDRGTPVSTGVGDEALQLGGEVHW